MPSVLLLGRNGRAPINLLKHGPKSVDLPRRANGNEGQLTNRRVRIIRVSQQDDVSAGIRVQGNPIRLVFDDASELFGVVFKS